MNIKSMELFEIINNRRSVRKFLEKPIKQEIFDDCLKAGFRAPFALQLCSVVYTKNKEKMKSLKIGVYPSSQVLIIFLIDLCRMEKIMTQRNRKYNADDGLILWLGIQDASLAAENLILAAESYGLGSVLLGAAPSRYDTISTAFNLPERVFPVVGLCLGYPDPKEETELRPRYPLKYSAFEDTYKDL
jgi:nitroreductase